MSKRVCMVVTDAVSFNVLCRDQLEFLVSNYDVQLTLVAGGAAQELERLESRGVGRVVKMPLKRKPDILIDLVCFFRLWCFFIFNRFDVVIYSTPKAMFLASIASFFSGQKRRYCLVRGRAYESFRGIKRKFYLILDYISLKSSTAGIAISSSLKDCYVLDGFDSDRLQVLGLGSSNGVDAGRFFPRHQEENVGEEIRIGVVGRICEDKGVVELDQVLRRVMAESAAIRFFLVGKVEDALGKYYIDEWLKDGLIEYSPHVENVQDFFRTLDLHLFLSHREGFGNVALEAAASGVPTFGFDVVGVRDSVKNNVSGLLFEFGDVAQVSRNILEAAQDINMFKGRFPKCREWAVANFEREAVWKRYFNFFLR